MHDRLLDALVAALPFVEDAESDPAYKPDVVRRLTRKIRGLIAEYEERAAGRPAAADAQISGSVGRKSAADTRPR